MQIHAALLRRRRGLILTMVKALRRGFGNSPPRHAATYIHTEHRHTYTHYFKCVAIFRMEWAMPVHYRKAKGPANVYVYAFQMWFGSLRQLLTLFITLFSQL